MGVRGADDDSNLTCGIADRFGANVERGSRAHILAVSVITGPGTQRDFSS